jgi:superoxide dismutase, Fe-Mn family
MKMLEQTQVSFDISKLKPVISEQSFDLHYNHIYSGHINRFNKGEGDIPFDKAGAFLHKLYFENIRELRLNNIPTGRVLSNIELRYGTYDRFLSSLINKAEQIQGNGWLFMNHSGYINIIPNNRIVDNAVLVIDCWEHAYIFNYGNDISRYIQGFINIINWDVVNNRINTINSLKKERHEHSKV